jgi:RNA polymerase sigma-70 factor (ECF subfamily)
MAGMEEQDLVFRCKEGDLESFNQLVEKYQRLVYNVSLRMLGQAPAAEDATQDAFICAFRGIGGFRGGNFKAWLLRIATNICRDQLRSRRRHPASPLDDIAPEYEIDHKAQSPEDYALQQELGTEIANALASIPQEQRLAVILYDIDGLSYEEVAEVMHCSLGTVRSRLSRGRERLRHLLAQRVELSYGEFRLKNEEDV